MNYRKSQIKIRDTVYGEIAARYIERYGGALQRELYKLKTPGTDENQAYYTVGSRKSGRSEPIDSTENREADSGWIEAGAGAKKHAAATGADAGRLSDPDGKDYSKTSRIAEAEKKLIVSGIETDDRILRSLTSARRKRSFRRFCIFFTIVACLFILVEVSGFPSFIVSIWETQVVARLNGINAERATPFGGIETNGTNAYEAETSGGFNDIDNAPDADVTADEIIPISIPIKPAYSVVSAIQDAGRTIYFIANEKQDNIVLSLRRGELSDVETTALTPASINGITVYLLYNADYSMLLFERDGVIHELTCKYDVNTLVDFCGFEYRGFSRGVLNPQIAESGLKTVKGDSLSGIPLKADNASYNDVRRRILNGETPPAGAIVTEEIIEYFLSGPAKTPVAGADRFTADFEIGPSPFNEGAAVAYVHIKAREYDWRGVPPSHIVILIDASSSMYSFDKLPLVKDAILQMSENLAEKDRLSILTYDGASEILLDNAGGDATETINNALNNLTAGVETYQGDGLNAAYALAMKNYIEGGANLVIAITDTDDSFGMADRTDMEALVSQYLSEGVELCVIAAGALTKMDGTTQSYLSGYENWRYVHAGTLVEMKQLLLNELTPDSYLVAGGASARIEFNEANVTSYRLIGYERRLSNATERLYTVKDMEHIYAGDEITLLYELTPARPFGETAAGPAGPVGDAGGNQNGAVRFPDELFELRIEYTSADEFIDETYKKAATFNDIPAENSADFHFACSVAAFCGLLDGINRLNADIGLAESLAEAGIGPDTDGRRAAYLDLLQKYSQLSGQR